MMNATRTVRDFGDIHAGDVRPRRGSVMAGRRARATGRNCPAMWLTYRLHDLSLTLRPPMAYAVCAKIGFLAGELAQLLEDFPLVFGVLLSDLPCLVGA
jgi:hypothetical protein